MAFAKVARMRADAIVAPGSALLFKESQRMVDFVAKCRLPAIYAGALRGRSGLMFYGTPFAD